MVSQNNNIRMLISFRDLFLIFFFFFTRGHESNTAWVFAAGGLSGIVSWVFTYPQDVIKSRIQADDICPKNRAYRNAYHCLKVSIKNEGYGMMVRGIGSTVIR